MAAECLLESSQSGSAPFPQAGRNLDAVPVYQLARERAVEIAVGVLVHHSVLPVLETSELVASGALRQVFSLEKLGEVVGSLGDGKLRALAQSVVDMYAEDPPASTLVRREANAMLRKWTSGVLEPAENLAGQGHLQAVAA